MELKRLGFVSRYNFVFLEEIFVVLMGAVLGIFTGSVWQFSTVLGFDF